MDRTFIPTNTQPPAIHHPPSPAAPSPPPASLAQPHTHLVADPPALSTPALLAARPREFLIRAIGAGSRAGMRVRGGLAEEATPAELAAAGVGVFWLGRILRRGVGGEFGDEGVVVDGLGDGRIVVGGGDFDELGVAVPFAAAGIAAPAVLAAAAVVPLPGWKVSTEEKRRGSEGDWGSGAYFVIVVDPSVRVLFCRTGLYSATSATGFDAPFAADDPTPACGAGFDFWEREVVFRGGGVEVLVCPRGALVGEEGMRPADAEPASLVLVDHECEADA